jgi:hypothetical protein
MLLSWHFEDQVPQQRRIFVVNVLDRALHWLHRRIVIKEWRFMIGGGHGPKLPVKVNYATIFVFFLRCDFLCRNGAALFFPCFDLVVLL